ncbi:T9SS type A sorting domain-containing protein [Flaviaesturariibacter aridisoli]|uniref:T9SS type A sorting domain-containing protein n=1 Tax=Flaviaesturariibacter aridisoli TaxID=2545761 RepID=A0A4R4DWD0_9BACT|nr:T9SS type A sorting domain-containing protein [Flaviaesturariibacter aridisoli]
MRHLIVFCLILLCVAAKSQRACSSVEYAAALRSANPSAARGMADADAFQAARARQLLTGDGSARMLASGVIQVPVVVHVLYNNAAQNISDDQIRSQIAALNRDFRHANEDSVNTPARFRGLAADVQLEFTLATATPEGYPTTGIVRKATNVSYWEQNDAIKFASSGGDNAWDGRYYLNIWVGPMRRLLGYSTLPGGPADVDGIVINTTAMGTFNVVAPYDKGRTATHEVGHWLGLRHIWGDTYCGDDGIDDTPKQSNFTSGCPSGFRVSCGNNASGDMYMNYMDYTSDACINLFTRGQAARMRSAFLNGGPRAALLQTRGLDHPWATPPVAAPVTSVKTIMPGNAALYPNPATASIQVNFDTDIWTGSELQLRNVQGALVQRIVVPARQMRIQVSALAAGRYFLLADNGTERLRLSFIKQ